MGFYIAADDGISGLEVGSEGRGVSRGAQATVGVNLCYLRVGENMESHATELLPNIQLLQPLPNIEKTS